jgi:hypothetical protein
MIMNRHKQIIQEDIKKINTYDKEIIKYVPENEKK